MRGDEPRCAYHAAKTGCTQFASKRCLQTEPMRADPICKTCVSQSGKAHPPSSLVNICAFWRWSWYYHLLTKNLFACGKFQTGVCPSLVMYPPAWNMSLASNSELNLWSRWGKTLSILSFYCFQLSISQKAMQMITHQHWQCHNPNVECVKFFCRENICLFCSCPPVTDDDTVNYSVIGGNDFGHCDGAKHQHVRSISWTAAASFKKISLTGWWSWAKLNQVRGHLRKKRPNLKSSKSQSLFCWFN